MLLIDSDSLLRYRRPTIGRFFASALKGNQETLSTPGLYRHRDVLGPTGHWPNEPKAVASSYHTGRFSNCLKITLVEWAMFIKCKSFPIQDDDHFWVVCR